MSKKSIILYEDWAETIKGLPIDIKCEVVDALLTYGFTNELPEVSQIVTAIIGPWCKELDKNKAKYQSRVDRMNKINEKHQNDIKTISEQNQNEVDTKSIRSRNDIASVDDDVDVYVDVDVDDNVDVNDNVSPSEIDISSVCEDLVGQYNSICVSLPKVTKLTETRKKAIRSRLKEYSFDEIIGVFEKAEASDFVSGRNKKWTSCNFDWLMKPGNLLKVIEDTYINHPDPISNRISIVDSWI